MIAEQPLDTAGVRRNSPLAAFQDGLEHRLSALLELPDEQAIDARWSKAADVLRAYALRPAKRVRPTLLVTGWSLAARAPVEAVPEGVASFAAALELLHTFMLIHDDVADRAVTRRGGAALHRLLAESSAKTGDDLAVIMGDHLFSRAVEVMLSSGAPLAGEATRYMMAVCRQTAVGQYLDLELSRTPLGEVNLFQTLKVAHLKTARYGFVAPLVVGAMLGGAEAGGELLSGLERVGRAAGMAFQLRDDLLGLFGVDVVSGKEGGADFFEGKRTFPVIAGWTRSTSEGRERLESLWHSCVRAEGTLGLARHELELSGGKAATERVIERMTRSARKSLEALPTAHGAREVLDGLLSKMVRRTA